VSSPAGDGLARRIGAVAVGDVVELGAYPQSGAEP
jgi:hypothetical protein